MMEQGPIEQSIISQAMRSDMPLPKRIQEAPELTLGLHLFYVAFLDLAVGSSGQISWGEVQNYGLHLDLDEETLEDLHYHIGQMDQARAQHVESKSRTGAANGQSGAVRPKNA